MSLEFPQGITTIGTLETRNDRFYRYKREIVKVRLVSKNGIQTEVSNLEMISKQLKVKNKDVLKEFSKKLGAMAKGNLLAGSFSFDILEDILQSYIEREVLCKKCRLPELSSKGECRSCGANAETEISAGVEAIRLDDSEDSEQEESDEVDPIAKEQCEYLHRLYDVRDEYLRLGSSTEDVNEAINRIWDCSDKSWSKLKSRLDQFFVHIGK